MKRFAILAFGLAVAAAWAAEAPALVVVHAATAADVRALMAAGVDVDTCAERRPDGVLAYVRPADLETLDEMGFGYEVLFGDARDAVRWTNEWAGARYEGHDAIPYDHYLSYDEFVAAMQEIANTYPAIARLSSVGKTVLNRDIWALKISKNPDAEEEEPELRLVGAHHGNERIGYMVALYAAEQLCARYAADAEVKALVDGAEIWAVPMLNADGVVANSRYNNHGIDLNRNYSYAWSPGGGGGSSPFSEPETRAIRDNGLANAFVMSHSYHSGAKYVNYVWNYKAELPYDVDEIVHISEVYGDLTGYPVTNGYAWYETHGDLNDWSYGERGDPDDTIEVYGPSYNPPVGQILQYCELNWPAVVATFKCARTEVIHGWVKDADTEAPLDATVTPLEINWPAYTDAAKGDYYKMLRPGTYTLKASADGYASATEAGVVLGDGVPTVVNFYLRKSGSGVTLDYFRAAARPAGVLLSWKVNAGEAAGYNLYRRAEGKGAAASPRTLVNGAPVAGRSPFRFLDADVMPGRWRYELDAVEPSGRAETVATADVAYAGAGKTSFALYPAYPNPARGAATIVFSLAAPARATLKVYDLAGREVATPFDGAAAAGRHTATVDAAALAPGVYLYRLTAGGDVATGRLAVTR